MKDFIKCPGCERQSSICASHVQNLCLTDFPRRLVKCWIETVHGIRKGTKSADLRKIWTHSSSHSQLYHTSFFFFFPETLGLIKSPRPWIFTAQSFIVPFNKQVRGGICEHGIFFSKAIRQPIFFSTIPCLSWASFSFWTRAWMFQD